jgi:hypothetical protein
MKQPREMFDISKIQQLMWRSFSKKGGCSLQAVQALPSNHVVQNSSKMEEALLIQSAKRAFEQAIFDLNSHCDTCKDMSLLKACSDCKVEAARQKLIVQIQFQYAYRINEGEC